MAKGKALLHDMAVVEVGEFVKMEAIDFLRKLRMMHYAINQSIVPKKDTQNYINKTDVEILWYVIKDVKINYAYLIMRWMKHKGKILHQSSYASRQTKEVLLYGVLITKILRMNNVPLQGIDDINVPHS